jgi:hypothetical protein
MSIFTSRLIGRLGDDQEWIERLGETMAETITT